MEIAKPRWSTASFLLYAGGLTVLGSALGSIAYLSHHYSDAAMVGWTGLVLVVLYGIAHAFRLRGRWIAAGVFAFASVLAWAAFVGALWVWFGWLSTGSAAAFHGFSVARLSLVLLVLASAIDDTRRFRFPFISAITAFTAWFFVTDLVSGGGNWSAVVTLLLGLVYLLAAIARDTPSSFWFHLAAGALIAGSLLYWWNETDTDYALLSVAALVFVAFGYGTKRSSWAVLGALGLGLAATHFAVEWSSGTSSFFGLATAEDWVPYAVFAFLGFLLVALGLRGRSQRPDERPAAAA